MIENAIFNYDLREPYDVTNNGGRVSVPNKGSGINPLRFDYLDEEGEYPDGLDGQFGDGYINLIGHKITDTLSVQTHGRQQYDSGIFDSDSFTFVFNGGKYPRDAAREIYPDGLFPQLPMHNKEGIVSSDDWEIGINGANLPYFSVKDVGQRKVFTFDAETPAGENVLFFRYSDRKILISRFSPEKNAITTTSFEMGGNFPSGGALSFNNPSGLAKIEGVSSNGLSSSIRLRNFLYFDEFLSNNQCRIIANEIYGTTGETAFISESGFMYEATGSMEVCIVQSGILYEDSVLSGYISGNCVDVTGDFLYEEQRGNLEAGDLEFFYVSNGDGTYYTDYTMTGYIDAITGIGITGQEVSTFCDSEIPVYYPSGVSGELYRDCVEEELGEFVYYENTGHLAMQEDGLKNGLSPRSASFIYERNNGDFVEGIIPAPLSNKNRTLQRTVSSFHEGRTLWANISPEETGRMTFYLNGAAMRIGASQDTIIVREGTEFPYLQIEKDFAARVGGELFFELKYTGVSEINNLHGVFDIFEEDFQIQELLITGTNQYGPSFGEIKPLGRDVFLNGIKLYEGAHYVREGDNFLPSGYVTGVTGLYFAWPSIGGERFTGTYDYSRAGDLERDSAIFWINGVRKSPREYVYHDIEVDLISGRNLEIEGGTVLVSERFTV